MFERKYLGFKKIKILLYKWMCPVLLVYLTR